MIKQTILPALVALGLSVQAQVGINCQYIPAIQIGSVKVKSDDNKSINYKYGAALPVMMLDRVGAKWYWNLDMNALYYGATSMNKANDGKIKIAKTEGGVFAGRVGRLFGKGDQTRFGINANLGYSMSNLDSGNKVLDVNGYMNLGGGLIFYKKFGKIRFVGKVGYESYSAKKYITKASGMYIETTFAYQLYQKYGISLSPCYYSKKFAYTPELTGAATATNAKLKSTVFRIGITKFL